MKKTIFTAFFASAILAFGAENLILNGNFKMGTTGYAQKRWLRFDTNPKQEYIPIETVKLQDEGYALKITSPYEERSEINARQFALKASTKYTIRAKMRSTAPVPVSFTIYSIANSWSIYSSPRYKIGPDWKEYEWHFTTKPKSLKGFFYHLSISIVKLKGELFIRDVELFENGTEAENGLQFAADVKEPILETTQKTLEWSVPVYAWNGTKKPFKGNVTVKAQEQFIPEKSHQVQVPVELAPGESKVFTVNFTTDYGCYEITEKCSEESRFVPAYQAVIGKYTAGKLDYDKDFCIGINGGLGIVKTAGRPELSTIAYNAGPEKNFEYLSKMGCRLVRDLETPIDPTAWSLMELKPGEWDYRHLDHSLDLYQKYNIEILACVGRAYCLERDRVKQRSGFSYPGFPQWVRDASIPVKIAKYNWQRVAGTVYVPPLDMWRAYADHLTAHAKGRIKYYEVFNEPNGYLPAEVYFPYLKTFYEEAKKNDPSCKIMFCVTSDFGATGDQFTTDMMKQGAGKYMDIASFHPYSGRELNSVIPADQYISNFRKIFGSESGKNVPIWNSELFYLYDNDRNVPNSELEVNPARITARMMVDLGEGVQQATQLYQYQFIQRRLVPEGWYDWVSNCEFLPSSTYVAFNAMARFLEAAKPVEKIFFDGGSVAYIFRKDGKLLAGLWNYQHKSNAKADLSMFDLYDVYGNQISAKKDMPVTDTPYYLKQGNLSDKTFMDAVKNLKFKMGIPIEPQPHARIADFNGRKILYVTLINVTDKERTAAIGFSGDGLTSSKTVSIKIPAKSKYVAEIPLRESKTASGEPTLSVYTEGSISRAKLKLHKNTMILAGTPVTLEKDDFKCTWNITGEGNNVILRFKVVDTTDSGESAGRDMWQQDCIEIFFDNDPLKLIGLNAEIYTPETFRMFVMPRLAEDKQFVSWIDPKSRFKASDLKYSSKVTPDGYEVEITILNENIADIIGLDVKVSDALPGKKAHRSAGWFTGKGSNMYRTVFNLIRFSEKEAAKSASVKTDLIWTEKTSPWKKTENGEFTINYQNKEWPRLTSKQQVKAGKFYKVTFDCKRDGDSTPATFLQANDGGKNFGMSVCTFNTWTTQCAYFPAAKDGIMSVICGLNPRVAAKMTVKNGKFEEVSAEKMKDNLILNGDFEDETVKGSAFWKSTNWKVSEFPGKIVSRAVFFSGEKSLEIPFGSGIQSIYVPMKKGEKYQLSFWAKGTKDAVIRVSLSLWNIRGHKGKHFARSQSFKLGNNWKEYKFEVSIPENEELYPDLKVGTGTISFSVKGSDGQYYLDDISYCLK